MNTLAVSASSNMNESCNAIINQAPLVEKTCWTVSEGTFERKNGSVFFTPNHDTNEQAFPLEICADLKVIAITRDYADNNYGYLIEWTNLNGKTRQRAIPADILQERDGTELRKRLANSGLKISTDPKARKKLTEYIQQACPDNRFALCTDKLGWYNQLYILPDAPIGQTNETIVFQSAGHIEAALSQHLGVDDWIHQVASLAKGNSRMILAICCAFAAPLLHLCGEHSGGFHLVGTSSSGKSTALRLAASVYGKPSAYMRSWRSTANGLEGIAALHNDGLLILDELSQVNPKEAGQAAYMLGNGQGKTRADQYGTARKITQWRLLFLSSGEESLESVIHATGNSLKAGQSIRFVEINADAGAGMGTIESLNGYASSAQLTQTMNDVAENCYGSVGLAWIKHIVAHRTDITETLQQKRQEILNLWQNPPTSGQINRVARRFALVSAAGEIASSLGLTGWNDQDVRTSIQKCFEDWRANFGQGDRETHNILENMNAFLGQYGDSRFEDPQKYPNQYVTQRLGFKRTIAEKGKGYVEYCIPTKTFKEYICQHYAHETVCRVLKEKGYLKPDPNGKNAQSLKFNGQTRQRYYVLRIEERSEEHDQSLITNTQ